ncbi:hypothetical protein [Jeotgalibacillus soli]|uniref:Uncharacterized protein n=1 Tax=Jeotgalibacillus soli TaxID=889306 RepID=A0A0C2VH78_9BACL|nr:hypothetical protein [Jeotgalibacillus soli]KIL48227.1 hypothetical protein KP78_16740 [Jeotgalibacillus soli]
MSTFPLTEELFKRNIMNSWFNPSGSLPYYVSNQEVIGFLISKGPNQTEFFNQDPKRVWLSSFLVD